MMAKNETIDEVIKNLTEANVLTPITKKSYKLFQSVEDAEISVRRLFVATDETVKEFKNFPEYNMIYQWMMEPNGKGLLMSGDSGRGKSLMALKVIPALLFVRHRLIVRPVDSYEIITKWEKIIKPPVIIVDDIGEEPPINDFGAKYEAFSRLVDYCEKNSKILIITSNLSSEQMMQRYGVRTIDRLDKLCLAVSFKGESLR